MYTAQLLASIPSEQILLSFQLPVHPQILHALLEVIPVPDEAINRDGWYQGGAVARDCLHTDQQA